MSGSIKTLFLAFFVLSAGGVIAAGVFAFLRGIWGKVPEISKKALRIAAMCFIIYLRSVPGRFPVPEPSVGCFG